MMKSFVHFVCVALVAGFGSAAGQTSAPENPESTAVSGKVVETMNAAGYTYVLLDTGATKLWAAATRFEVKVGDVVGITREMPMPNYHSKTLNRDFDLVYFTGSVTVNGKAAGATPPATAELPENHPPIPAMAMPAPDLAGIKNAGDTTDAAGGVAGAQLPKDHPRISQAAAKPLDLGGIKTADGGKTVSEIVTGRAELSGQEVAVRGKVVKYNDGVLGKNWLHIRDGSGSEGSNDLTVTTTTSAKVGDIVLVRGKVGTDRDFGAGYKYSVIIEDGQVTVE